MKKIGIIAILILCIFLVAGCEKVKKEKKTETKTEVANPLVELATKEELEKTVGFEVPVIEEKEIISYIAIGQDEVKKHARVLYQDGSELDMIEGIIKDQEEISGIYGAEETETIKISRYKIKVYEYEETIFGIWRDADYTYSYSIQNSDIDKLKKNIEQLIN